MNTCRQRGLVFVFFSCGTFCFLLPDFASKRVNNFVRRSRRQKCSGRVEWRTWYRNWWALEAGKAGGDKCHVVVRSPTYVFTYNIRTKHAGIQFLGRRQGLRYRIRRCLSHPPGRISMVEICTVGTASVLKTFRWKVRRRQLSEDVRIVRYWHPLGCRVIIELGKPPPRRV